MQMNLLTATMTIVDLLLGYTTRGKKETNLSLSLTRQIKFNQQEIRITSSTSRTMLVKFNQPGRKISTQ